jgi:tRNA pseudouridine38-40 synthase
MRVALGIEYNGASFCGFQTQKGERTVQECLELALSDVADHQVVTRCAGRTDAGVHALFQVTHFDTVSNRSKRAWVLGVNSNLPSDISVIWAKKVDNSFHARFSAIDRTYHYFILNSSVRSAILDKKIAWKCKKLDVSAMRNASKILIGEHDFSTFRASRCQARSPVRILQEIIISEFGGAIVFKVKANAFLQHMVRNVVGSLLEVGSGRRSEDWIEHILEKRERRFGGATAPAEGLYLTSVNYPSHYGLPNPSRSQSRIPWLMLESELETT